MAKQLLKILENSRTRTLVLVTVGILVFGTIVAVMSLSASDDPLKNLKSKSASVPRGVESIPGAKTTDRYKELVAKANIRGQEEAKEKGESFVPTIGGDPRGGLLGGKSLESLFDEALKESEGAGAGAGGAGDGTGTGAGLGGGQDPRLAALLAEQQRLDDEEARRLADQQRQLQAELLREQLEQERKAIEAIAKAMDNQASAAIRSWTNIPQQVYIRGDWAPDDPVGEYKSAKEAATGGSDGQNDTSSNGDSEEGEILVQAGDILFAVVETAVNSDFGESPVLARVVGGQLKGARVIGKFRQISNAYQKKLIIEFDRMNIEGEDKSFAIKAFAIDPETSRTAIATGVDNHYLFRYGSLFASTFLEGYASAVAESSGSTTTSTQSGIVAGLPTNTQQTTKVKPPTSGKEQFFEGISEFGTALAEAWSENVNRPATITIDQGTGVGLLFIQDAKLGTPIEEETKTAASTAPAQSGLPAESRGLLLNSIVQGAAALATAGGPAEETR